MADVDMNDKENLLAALTGINASKISYYRELKEKIRELESSNAQLREAKYTADELYEQVRRNADELAQLYEKSQVQAERLDRAISSLKSISQVLTATTQGVEALLQAVVRTAAELFETEYAVMTLSGSDNAQQRFYCAYGSPSGPMAAVPPRSLCRLIDTVIEDQRPVFNVTRDNADSAVIVCVPMFREETLVGTICLQAREGCDFAESDISILQTLANQAAVAIENARLFEESQHLQAETKRLYEIALQQKSEAEKKTRELEQARNELGLAQKEQLLSEERNRIARELHDSVAQILTSIGLNLEWCRQQLAEDSPLYEKILCLKQLARNGIYEIRNTIYELSAINISELGLAPALVGISQEFQRITGIEADLTVVGEVRRLPLNGETALYRVAQEALYNVFKHAQATHVDLKLEFTSHELLLTITDNGIGIPEEAIKQSREGTTFGLKNMWERIEKLKGKLQITDLNGSGTRVTAIIPMSDMNVKMKDKV